MAQVSESSPIRNWSFAIVRTCGDPNTRIISRNAARKAAVHAKRSEFSDTDVRLADFADASRSLDDDRYARKTVIEISAVLLIQKTTRALNPARAMLDWLGSRSGFSMYWIDGVICSPGEIENR